MPVSCVRRSRDKTGTRCRDRTDLNSACKADVFTLKAKRAYQLERLGEIESHPAPLGRRATHLELRRVTGASDRTRTDDDFVGNETFYQTELH